MTPWHAALCSLLLAASPQPPVAFDPGDPSSEVIGRASDQALAGRTDWLGLYERDGGWRLERTAVEIRPGDLQDLPSYRVLAEPGGPRLLLSAVPGLRPGPATVAGDAVLLSQQTPSAGFTVGGRRYVVTLRSRQPNYCDAVVTVESGGVRQTLYEPATAGRSADPQLTLSCDEPHFEVKWAGDLDRDQRLDLLVTFSPKYSYHPQRLWLSSAAAPGALVGSVSLYELMAA